MRWLFLWISFPLLGELIVPNGSVLPHHMDGDVKVFHLVAEEIQNTLAPGLTSNCWGYNGQTPGPVIEATEGERLRIYVTNHLPEYTTVHWHGLIVPNGMDGVGGLTQPVIQPGETFVYEFDLVQNGTFLYHPHADARVQNNMGLVGMIVIHPKEEQHPVERDFCLLTQIWQVPVGASSVNPYTMEANYFTFNGAVYPGCEPLVAKKGDRVRMRWGNLTPISHPIHLHGYEFTVVSEGAKRLPKSAQYTAVMVALPTGFTKEIEFTANNLGDWALHCHKLGHTLNGILHSMPNMMGVELSESVIKEIQHFLPDYHPIGVNGMGDLFTAEPVENSPPNFLPLGSKGPYGVIDDGGMFTLFKVRDQIEPGVDPGWYVHPQGTTAHRVEIE